MMIRLKEIFKISRRQVFVLSGLLLCLILAPVIFSSNIFAQAPTSTPVPTPQADEEVIKIDSKLVQIEAIVKDKKGNIIRDLTADDFELVEGGKVRPIEFFSFVPITVEKTAAGAAATTEADETKGIKPDQVKRTMVFLVSNPNIKLTTFINTNFYADTRTTTFQQFSLLGLAQSTKFLEKFINEKLSENDLVSINDTEANLGPLSNFTNDKEVLLAATKQMRSSLKDGRYPTHNINLFLRDRTVEWDAGDLIQQNLNTLRMAESAIDQLQKVPGQKFVFLISRGMLGARSINGADAVTQRVKRIIEKANQAKVTFYSLGIKNLGEGSAESPPPPGVVQSSDMMRQLAEKTGGRGIFNTNDISIGFNEILAENSGYYQLAFTPDDSSEPKAYQVKVNLKRRDLVAQYRSSVYQNSAVTEETTSKERVLKLLKTPFAADTVKVRLVTNYNAPGKGDKKQGKITTAVTIDPKLFEPQMTGKGVREIKLNLGIQVTEPNNAIARQDVKTFSLKVSEESWRQIVKEGLVYQFETTTAKQGTYLIKIAACINDSDQCGNAESFVTAK